MALQNLLLKGARGLGMGIGAAKVGLSKLGSTGRGALAGAAVGGFMGTDNGTSGFFGGAIAGAAGGAAFARFGGGLTRKAGALLGPGLNKLGNSNLLWSKAGRSGGMTLRGGNLGVSAHNLIGNMSQNSNKYAGRALAGLAMGAAGLIGSSILSSNSR